MDAELEEILKIFKAIPKPTTHPVELSDEYLRLIAHVEALPRDQTGADKSWVPNLLVTVNKRYRGAVRVR